MPTSSEIETAVRDTARTLRADLDSKTPTVPSEIVWSYQDKTVQKAICRRLAQGGSVYSIKSLLPDIVTAYRRVHIIFSVPTLSTLNSDGILIQVNESNKVADIIDPFFITEEKRRLVEETEGTFLTAYSTPLTRSGRGDNEINARYERFVKEEGVGVAFARLRLSLGQGGGGVGIGGVFADFASGTCVATTYRIPTVGKPGSSDPFPGTEGIDADEQEDDSPVY